MFFLVIDDETAVRMMVANLLESSGLAKKVLVCPCAQDALDDLKNQPVNFIISDWNMPGMSGLDLLKTVRTAPELEKVRTIPFLLLTAEAHRNNIIEAAKAGVTDYVVKPFKPDTLLNKVERILKQSAAGKNG